MGGPGTERATRHKLNAVPHHVGHGERLLVIGEPPAPCRCYHPNNHHSPPGTIILPSPPPLGSLHARNSFNATINLDSINNNNNYNDNNASQRNSNHIGTNEKSNHAKVIAADDTVKKAAMSSPPKHRRGFDPNDSSNNDFRRYRRVKTRQRGFVCSHRDLQGWAHRPP
ncbi:uncharacterized ENTR1 family protein-like [Venturia canescens]|uniref:uncharacterized ENTR1 family protein-like n=1 Tax=Venturia canescens TaxID=32260 RepID=UPI001C9CF413|nr:uncharacterized ENTR1 family protein-like [Venturia canescens]XP_043289598.1 uncharacterized ENTR1 family protein-like [Venturia canescens]XP_043289599.1 uncharacterized ENTR1 family protein-like [Venturia canescens]